jgi:3-deoxy-D-manno-octulosonate 8-phosphate phosphatase (KDO 8-P phosphatase)
MRKTKKEFLKKAKNIKLLILDVDGVMTDGSIILDNQGNEIKTFHVRDGHGIKMALKAGVEIAIITGRESRVVERRALELGIKEVYQKVMNKVDAYEKMIKKYGLKDEEVAFIGDDINDLTLLRRVGFSVAVADSDSHIKKLVDLVTEIGGGKGAVREVIDLILKAQGKWEGVAEKYMSGDLFCKIG